MMQEKKVSKAASDTKLAKTPEVKAEVKSAVKNAAKKVETKVEAVAETTAKKAEETVATTKKAVAEKKAEPAAAKKTERKTKTTAKAAAAPKEKKEKQPAKTEVIVEYQQNATNLSEIEDKVKAKFVAEGHRAGCIKTLNIYVKPEEYKAYYVINDKFFGNVDLF